ncbi:helix-turn-helix domain-containing protein [Mucilaginibacter sp.]|uniref:helix-turn-helix domain-containing protein n=1 Tax=Mucilaginibacter sp. TaxID=1882438 RepID=UPI003D12E87A
MKAIKVPNELTCAPYYQRELKLNGVSLVESCTLTHRTEGSMYLGEHMLLVVLEGTNTITHGKNTYVVNKHEMVLLKKAVQVSYDKCGNPGNNYVYDSMLFFIKDEFLKEFIKMTKIESVNCAEAVLVSVKPVKERLLKFFESLKPYFNEPENIDAGLIRLKMLELLYDLASTDKNLFQQILQLKQPVYSDITHIVEENYANPITLTDMAYLSGRSLSSFKRDFQAIYQVSPAKWIREKRLAKARQLLQTNLPVKDVCYSLGFESVAHFSRLFKEYFGHTPSETKSRVVVLVD